MFSANIYTSAPHYQIFHNKKLELLKNYIFCHSTSDAMPNQAFFTTKAKKGTLNTYCIFYIY